MSGKPGSSSSNKTLTAAATGLLPQLNVDNPSPPPQDSSPPSGDQNQSPPSPPQSPSDNGNSTSAPLSPPPSNSESSPPPSPPSPSNKSPPPSPPSDSSPPPKASSPPPEDSSSPPPPPPPTPTSSSSSSSPPPSPPPASSNKPLSPPPPPPPPPSVDNAPAPPSNETTTPPPSEGSISPPSPPPKSISPPSPLSPPIESPPSPDPSPSTVITSPRPQSASPPPHRATPNLSPPSNTISEADSPSSSSSNNTTQKTVVGVAVAGAFLIALIAIFFVACKRRKRRRVDAYAPHYMPPSTFSVKSDGYYYAQQPSMVHSGPLDSYQPPTHSHLVNSHGSQRGQMYPGGGPDTSAMGAGKTFFSYEELMDITGGFSSQNILGEGGFGCVYKGWLPDGRVVAVKQLKAGSGQGEREFRAEVDIISRVHHRHLVSLVGYCISESHRLLIYEFVPNRTLEQHLYGSPVLDWPKRVRIAIGAAKGLAYLHEDCHPKIIHRDIKSANILLDDAFEAKVADFGLAKLNDSTQTHVSTRVMGTFGYMAPEYASSGKLTDRSDVFSFGVVLLELITGRKPVDSSQPLGDESLVEWARPLLVHALETGDFSELVDVRLQKHYVESEVFRMIEAAAACVRHSAPKRPRMMQVVRALDSEGEISDLSNGVKYGQSTVYDSGQYNQDIKKFRRMALGSDNSSEFDMNSGDYTSRDVSHGFSNFTSGESETRAMTGHSSAQSRYAAPRF